jgi:hypothetical protein
MTHSGTIALYEEPDGTLVVRDELLGFQRGADRKLKEEVVISLNRLEGLADGWLEPAGDRYDDAGDPKSWIYWRPVGRIGALYHVPEERQPGPRLVLVLRVALASTGLPADADVRSARQRLASS